MTEQSKYTPVENMSPLEMADEFAQLREKLVKNDLGAEDLHRAIELARTLRRTSTGPAKTRKKKSDVNISEALGLDLPD